MRAPRLGWTVLLSFAVACASGAPPEGQIGDDARRAPDAHAAPGDGAGRAPDLSGSALDLTGAVADMSAPVDLFVATVDLVDPPDATSLPDLAPPPPPPDLSQPPDLAKPPKCTCNDANCVLGSCTFDCCPEDLVLGTCKPKVGCP